MNRHFLFLALLAAAPLATAQTRFYSPAPFAHHDGLTSTGYPIGYSSYTKMTYQQVHGDLPAVPQPILRLAFRPRSTSASHAAYAVNLTLVLSLGGPLPSAASATFAANLGPSPMTVLNQSTVNIPAFTQAGTAPAPYHYAFPFPVPFLYDGKGVLCWEMRVHSHSFTGTSSLSFDLYSTQTAVTLRSGGVGCTCAGQAAPATLSGSSNPGSLALNCNGLPAAQPVLLLIGIRSTMYGPLPLPFDLTPLGAPCALRTDMLLTAAGLASAGTASWQFPVPAAAPDGTAVFFQVLAPDAAANPLGLVLSNGLAAVWPYAKQPAVRIWKTADDQALSGSLQLTYGLVTELGL